MEYVKSAENEILSNENFKVHQVMTFEEAESAYNGNLEKMSAVFNKAALEQGISKNILDAHFADFNLRIHEMVDKMATCENCTAGLKCPNHVIEVRS